MEASEFYNALVQRLLSEQMPNGEFGKSRNQSVVGVVSPYHNAYVPGRKANSFVTMYSIDVLHKLGLGEGMTKRAAAWFASRISEDGYFLSDISISEQVEDLVTGNIMYVPSIIKIYRHTAEALYSLLLIDGINAMTVKMFTNLLDAQNTDGGWSASSSNNKSQLLATSFTLKAITALNPHDIISKGFAPYDQESKRNLLETSIHLALRWFELQSHNAGGLWHLGMEKEVNKAFYTGIILGMTPSLFVEQMPKLTTDLVNKLISCSCNGVWYHGVDNEIDLDGSARILASLVKLRKLMPFDFDFESSLGYLQKCIEPKIGTIDPATLCFVIDALYEYKHSHISLDSETIYSVVAIYNENHFLGSGFISKVNNKTACFTCKHIFKNSNSDNYKFVCGSGSIFSLELYVRNDAAKITTNSSANEDILLIYLDENVDSYLQMQESLSDKFYSTFGYGVSAGGRGRWSRNLIYMGFVNKGFCEMRFSDKVLESGFSGSPVFNSRNEVIGMIQSIKGESVYIIPSKSLVDFTKKESRMNESHH